MNRENVQKLLDHLKSLTDDQVNMSFWFFNEEGNAKYPNDEGEIVDLTKCGSAACLAGWAVYLFATPEDKRQLSSYNMAEVADKYLGLWEGQPDDIARDAEGVLDPKTCPYTRGNPYGRHAIDNVTRKEVIKYLEARLAAK